MISVRSNQQTKIVVKKVVVLVVVVVGLGMILSDRAQKDDQICGQRSAGWTELYTTVTINRIRNKPV